VNIERSDWRPVWELCKRIQEEFKTSRDFDNKDERQRVWQKFKSLRDKASELADYEKEIFETQSSIYRDEIVGDAKSCIYSVLTDKIFFFDPTTVDDMKRLSQELKRVGQRLSECKRWMTKAHKEECFSIIQQARESHDFFWERRKALSAERREATERRREEFETRRQEWKQRVWANLEKNREKLSRAKVALGHTQERISDIESKIYETTSDKWRDIFSGWLAEAREKERDIQESISRIEEWIGEDESKYYS